MNPYGTLREIITGLKAQVLNTIDAEPWSGYLATSPAGVTVSDTTVLRMAASWTAIRLISETLATMPMELRKHTPDGTVLAHNHPAYRVVNKRPNSQQTPLELFESIAVSLCIYGQAYALPNRLGEELVGLAFLPKSQITPRLENGEARYRVQVGQETQEMVRGEVVPIKGFGGGDSLEGFPVYSMQCNALGLAQAAEEYGARYFSNGARPNGFLSVEQILNDDQRKVFKERWADIQGSITKAHGLGLLEAGMKYNPVADGAKDAQLIETRIHQLQEVARIWRIPLRLMLDDGGMTYNSRELDMQQFLQTCIQPYMVRIEQAFNTTLLSLKDQKKYFFQFDPSELLRTDQRTLVDNLYKQRAGNFITIDEGRRALNLPPIGQDKGGNDVHVPMNMLPSDMVRDFFDEDKTDDSNQPAA